MLWQGSSGGAALGLSPPSFPTLAPFRPGSFSRLHERRDRWRKRLIWDPAQGSGSEEEAEEAPVTQQRKKRWGRGESGKAGGEGRSKGSAGTGPRRPQKGRKSKRGVFVSDCSLQPTPFARQPRQPPVCWLYSGAYLPVGRESNSGRRLRKDVPPLLY